MRLKTWCGVTALLLLVGCAGTGIEQREFVATLTGYQTAAPGNLEGTGTATLRIDPVASRLCWELTVRGIGVATEARLLRGAAGTEGVAVVPLRTPGPDGRSEGCTPILPAIAAELSRAPYFFYVEVATRDYPGGAIRGQLRGRRAIEPRPRSAR